MNANTLDGWPPQCCGAAFIDQAMILLGGPKLERSVLAKRLNIRVALSDSNPWGLEIATNPLELGAHPKTIETRWRDIFPGVDSSLAFRYVPFDQITAEMYWDVCSAALDAGLVVGVGFDYAIVSNGARSPHVCRVRAIEAVSGDRVSLYDDSADNERASLQIKASSLESAVINVAGGFWLVGAAENMSIEYTLPWRADN